MPEVPRLTRALRAFTDLGRKKQQSVGYTTGLAHRKQEQAANLTRYRSFISYLKTTCPKFFFQHCLNFSRKLSWKEFCKELPKNVGPLLTEVHSTTAKFCGKSLCLYKIV